MWIDFNANAPFAIKVYVGPINAVSGKSITTETNPSEGKGHDKPCQDYVVVPQQAWLDGIVTGNGTVKQFVAMKHGDGYTVEARMTGEDPRRLAD